jgi:hypothetical protein
MRGIDFRKKALTAVIQGEEEQKSTWRLCSSSIPSVAPRAFFFDHRVGNDDDFPSDSDEGDLGGFAGEAHGLILGFEPAV